MSEETTKPRWGPPPEIEDRLLDSRALFEQVRAGDVAARDELVERLSGAIAMAINAVFTRAGQMLSATELDAMVTEVWRALLRDDCRRLSEFDRARDSSLRRWVTVVSAQMAGDRLLARLQQGAGSGPISGTPRGGTPPLVDERPVVEVMRRAMLRFSDEDQAFLRSCFRHNWGAGAVAGELGLSVDAVLAQRRRVRRRLTRELQRLIG